MPLPYHSRIFYECTVQPSPPYPTVWKMLFCYINTSLFVFNLCYLVATFSTWTLVSRWNRLSCSKSEFHLMSSQNVYVHKIRDLCSSISQNYRKSPWKPPKVSVFQMVRDPFFHFSACLSMALSTAAAAVFCLWEALIQRKSWNGLARANLKQPARQ